MAHGPMGPLPTIYVRNVFLFFCVSVERVNERDENNVCVDAPRFSYSTFTVQHSTIHRFMLNFLQDTCQYHKAYEDSELVTNRCFITSKSNTEFYIRHSIPLHVTCSANNQNEGR